MYRTCPTDGPVEATAIFRGTGGHRGNDASMMTGAPALKNLLLAIYLAAMCGYSGMLATGAANRLDFLLYLGATLVLVANTLRRPVATQQDNRPMVWLLCVASSSYFLAFEGTTLPAVILLHLLGDISLMYLGRSFAILPALRGVRTGWLYRWVRHPTYLTYVLTDAVFVATAFSARNLALALVGLGLFVYRAHLEEALLMVDSRYMDYCRRTRYRFIPGVY